jgi:predicted SnoaL-like aldol condensation-catalyzing enzyme
MSTDTSPGQATSPKQVALDFFDTVFKQRKPMEGADAYIGDSYKQHNPTAPDGRDGFKNLVGGLFDAFPDFDTDIKRVFEDGDHVIIHHHFKTTKDDRGTACVDIFKVADGKIVEHWDVLQPVPEESANDNTMF